MDGYYCAHHRQKMDALYDEMAQDPWYRLAMRLLMKKDEESQVSYCRANNNSDLYIYTDGESYHVYVDRAPWQDFDLTALPKMSAQENYAT